MKRSTRTVVVSKAFKVVDTETRRDIRDRRLLALEADNYVENETVEEEDYEAEVNLLDDVIFINRCLIFYCLLFLFVRMTRLAQQRSVEPMLLRKAVQSLVNGNKISSFNHI